MSSGEEAAELKKLSPTKNVSSSSKLIYSDSDSDKSETENPPRGRGRPKKSKLKDLKSLKKTESSSEVRTDSDSTQHSLDRPKEFKTKAAMMEFTAADMEAAKKILEEKKVFAAKNKSKPPYVSSDEESIMEVDADINNDFLLVPQRKAASKAQKKISKVEDKKKKASKASDLLAVLATSPQLRRRLRRRRKVRAARTRRSKRRRTASRRLSRSRSTRSRARASTVRRARKKSLSICQKQSKSHQRKRRGRGRWISVSVTLMLSRAARRGKSTLVRRKSRRRSLLPLIIF